MTALAAADAVVAVRAVRVRARRRERRTVALLVLTLLALAAVSLAVGAYAVSPLDAVRALTGQGEGAERFVVLELRLPRLALAVVAGVAFAVSGALFQSVLRNPLASPDILGVTAGASVGAVTALLVLELSGAVVSAAAFVGALAVAATLAALSWRGGVSGYRFVVAGVGLAFLAGSWLAFLLSRAEVRDAQAAMTWMVGSLGSARWEEIGVAAACLVVLLPLAALQLPALRALELGPEAAVGLGVNETRARLGILVTAVALAAVATAAAGPIAFVAFVAAPVSRRLLGASTIALLPASLVGAVVVVVSDLVALRLLPGDVQVPVGVVTGLVGAVYLVALLAAAGARSRV